MGIADTDLSQAEARFQQWLDKGYAADMSYMWRHGTKRSRPAELEPETLRVISVSLDYQTDERERMHRLLEQDESGFVSRYALGRDYHKMMRKRLQRLAEQISEIAQPHHYRVFVDSAPVLEKPLAEKAGLGWIGKHTGLVNRHMGSWFFLGEIYTNLPLPVDQPTENHCGSCQRCIDICPTAAIVGPYQLDARRCISYLTIEHDGPIPLELRPLMGNRIYGCDDCQLVCPWNRYAQLTDEQDFKPRNNLDESTLLSLFGWSEQQFLTRTEGSAIRRIGFQRWQRNIAVALGNMRTSSQPVIEALSNSRASASTMVLEHLNWALEQHEKK